jgi:hypothetical protein
MFLIYSSDVLGVESNCLYPHSHEIKDADSLKAAVTHDYVCAEYKNSYRLNENFIGSNCLPVDCDNDHSDNPNDWITKEKVEKAFPGVSFAVHYSRHNNLPKGDKSARPRAHYLFPIDRITDAEEYANLKKRLNDIFPYFDKRALDAARFFYGTQNSEVEIVNGTMTLTVYMDSLDDDFDSDMGSGSYGNYQIKQGSRNSEMSHIAGKLIKRYGNTEESRHAFLEMAAKCDPPLSQTELRTIWNSAKKFGKKIKKQEGYVSPEEYNKEPEWETPIPFEEYNLPAFPVDALPGAIADYVKALAESTQTPIDMAATSAIAVMSVCMQGKFKIQAKEDWSEPVNTFVLDVMNPSERKSAVQNAMIQPINLYEAKQNIQNAALIESSKMQKRILEKRQRVVEEQVIKGKANEDDVNRIAEEVANYKEVKPLKLYVDDITTEKLTSVLANNDGRAAILSTEGGIFDTLAGTYSKNVNIDVMLKGYSGDSIRVDRIGRNSESILNPTLTILLMVQPSVLSGLMQNGTFRGRGLTARFLYCIPTSNVGNRKYRSKPVPLDVYQNYEKCIYNLLDDETPKKPEVITLSDEADKMVEEFAEKLEPQLKEKYADIADWAGKLVGNVLRIAALLCRAKVIRSHDFLDEPEPLVVSGDVMAQAILIGEYFVEHARAAFTLMGVDHTTEDGKYVLKAIKDSGLAEFTRRDIMRLCRKFKKADDVQAVLEMLIEYGYISEKAEKPYLGKGRPPLTKYVINPIVWSSVT